MPENPDEPLAQPELNWVVQGLKKNLHFKGAG